MIKVLLRPLTCALYLSQTVFGSNLGKAAVLDFELENRPEVNENLEKYAANRFSIEIGKRFNLVDRTIVKRVQDEMGIRTPYKVPLLGRLATELNTQTLFVGKMSGFTLKKSKAGGNRAKLKIDLEMIDSVSGKIIDHCFVSAKSSPGGAKDQVFQEAISHGCYELAQKIMSQYQPSATIQNLIGNRALINIGSREGYKLGQELIVYRGKLFVGMAKIVLLENMYAEIAPINGLTGLSTGDMVRAVSVHISQRPKNSSKKVTGP